MLKEVFKADEANQRNVAELTLNNLIKGCEKKCERESEEKTSTDTSQREPEPRIKKWYVKPGKTDSFKNFKLKPKATMLDLIEFKQHQEWFWPENFDLSIPEPVEARWQFKNDILD